jgi:hypothetical protein
MWSANREHSKWRKTWQLRGFYSRRWEWQLSTTPAPPPFRVSLATENQHHRNDSYEDFCGQARGTLGQDPSLYTEIAIFIPNQDLEFEKI